MKKKEIELINVSFRFSNDKQYNRVCHILYDMGITISTPDSNVIECNLKEFTYVIKRGTYFCYVNGELSFILLKSDIVSILIS